MDIEQNKNHDEDEQLRLTTEKVRSQNVTAYMFFSEVRLFTFSPFTSSCLLAVSFIALSLYSFIILITL